MTDATIESPGDTDPVTLLFSGGVDSTMAACKLAETQEHVHLVSFNNGYGHYKMERTAQRADEVRQRYPGKVSYQLISVRELFEHMVLSTLEADYRRYGSGFIWCMGCKLAMHTRTIIYNVENDVYRAADGSSFATSEMVEQMPLSVGKIRGFYCEYGFAFRNPVYTNRREDSIVALKRMGFRQGLRIRDRFLGVQPKCKPGELYYMPLILRGTQPRHQEDDVADYIETKLEWAREYLKRTLSRPGDSR
jgi:hypothetical protein